jgi:hypothetical protein
VSFVGFGSAYTMLFVLFMVDYQEFGSKGHYFLGEVMYTVFGHTDSMRDHVLKFGDGVGLLLLNTVMLVMMLCEIAVLGSILYLMLLYPKFASDILGTLIFYMNRCLNTF